MASNATRRAVVAAAGSLLVCAAFAGDEPTRRAAACEVVIDATDDHDRPLPVRVVVTASDGSHPDGSAHGAYGDGRFFADGKCTVKVPAGATKVMLASGPNHIPAE